MVSDVINLHPYNVDYLTQTMESLLAELPSDPHDPFFARVKVRNNGGGLISFFLLVGPACVCVWKKP